MVETILKVSGMTCPKCEKHVEEALGTLPGVASVKADRTSSSVRVESQVPIDVARAREVVEDAGYDLVE